MPHEFIELRRGAAADLASLIAIYQDAIDPSEQKTPAEIEAMLDDPRYLLFVSRTDGVVSGFAITFFPESADFWLLEYMAVAAAGRGRRIGEALFRESHRRGLARDPQRVMVLEVDQPGSSSNPANDTHGRYRFYQRVGCVRVGGLGYILPLETGTAPPAMMLLTYSEPALHVLPKARVAAWLSAIYSDVYGQKPDDPRIETMLSGLPSELKLQPL